MNLSLLKMALPKGICDILVIPSSSYMGIIPRLNVKTQFFSCHIFVLMECLNIALFLYW